MNLNCTFTSVWDDGSVIVTPATYDPKTGEVSAESTDACPDGSLEREFITLTATSGAAIGDEEEIEVCTDCHTHTMKTVMGDRGDCSYGEYTECRNPDCDSNSINYV